MARRAGYRGGRGGASGFGRGRNGGRRKGGSARRGQVNGGKAVQYRITDRRGKATYVGTTSSPRRRAAEHKRVAGSWRPAPRWGLRRDPSRGGRLSVSKPSRSGGAGEGMDAILATTRRVTDAFTDSY